jgi:hypothetical protein
MAPPGTGPDGPLPVGASPPLGRNDRTRLVAIHAAGFAALTVVLANAHRVLPVAQTMHRPHMPLRRFLGNWLIWDGGWYLHIARSGYFYRPGHQSSVAFFPVYPLAVRWLGSFTGMAIAALVISVAAGALAVQLFWTWCRDTGDPRPWGPVLALVSYPYAFFLYGFSYSDNLFLSLSIGAFLAVHRRRYRLGGLLGMVATATRPTGICLVAGLAAVAWHQEQRAGTVRPASRLSPLALAPGGLAAWCAYLWLRFGDPLAFVHTEGAPGWGNGPGWRTWLKVEFFHAFTNMDAWGYGPLLAQAAVCAVLLALVPVVWRRYGWGYGAYALLAVVVPLVSTGDFQGTGRYAMAAFPIFAVIGSRLAARPALARVAMGAGVAGMFLAAGLFSTGHLVS